MIGCIIKNNIGPIKGLAFEVMKVLDLPYQASYSIIVQDFRYYPSLIALLEIFVIFRFPRSASEIFIPGTL